MATPAPAQRKITKRACDGCKIRKIKCSELPPCTGCTAVGIPCTFKKHPSTRGPRKLRPKTIQQIAETQQEQQELPPPIPLPPPQKSPRNERRESSNSPAASIHSAAAVNSPPTALSHRLSIPRSMQGLSADSSRKYSSPTPIPTLVLQLCVYRLRMFPVWPIVAVEDVMGPLQKDEKDMETYALANAIGAATIAQLKLNATTNGTEIVTGFSMEAECQRARSLIPQQVNLNTIRTAFFLHVYHENQEAGGAKSLLYLREAITMAQIMGLHKEATYSSYPAEEQQHMRRVLWLLFVTERGVAMLHKLPVVLKSNVLFPSIDEEDEISILPAFRKLVNLFWMFDQSGAFDILQNSDAEIGDFGEIEPAHRKRLSLLQQKLEEVSIDSGSGNDVQTADICVTRQWMHAVLWRVSMNRGLLPPSGDQSTSLSYPMQIAKEFLGVISRLPTTAIEAHGPTMELKIYEIANSVADAISNGSVQNGEGDWANRSRDVLNQLHRILSSCRGGNKQLVTLLRNRITSITNPQLLLEPSNRFEEVNEQWTGQNEGMNGSPVVFAPPVPHSQPSDGPGTFGGISPGFAQLPQQPFVFSWDAMGEENPMSSFGGSFDGVDPSVALDRLLGDTMGDGWMSIRSAPSPVSQWL